jgi:hypothetical protein
MNGLINQDLTRRIAPLAVGVPAAFLIGYTVSSATSLVLPLAVYGGLTLALAFALPPHVFVPAALLVVGVSTAFESPVVSAGQATLYVSDLAVLLVLFRGVTPRARHPARRALAGVPEALFLLWLFIMVAAGARAILAGVPTASVIRSDLALIYWPMLYFGLTRIFAEIGFEKRLLWRNLALVAVGFAVYMFFARILNHPFQDPGLAQVPTGVQESVPRNFGFASAFTIYPVLAIAAVAAMANSGEHRARSIALASIGVIATLTTLVRGEIFGLGLGILLVLWLSPRRGSKTGRARTAVQVVAAATAAVLAVLAVDPKLGHAVIQRTVPLVHQAPGATANADYRFEAMGSGIRVARAHPLGLGVLDQPRLAQHNIESGYLVHSGFATLLIYGGWVAFGAAVLAVFAAIRRSFQTAAASPWLHAAFVGAIVMLSVYSLGAAGLAGDSWVVPLGALVVALRFGLRPEPE